MKKAVVFLLLGVSVALPVQAELKCRDPATTEILRELYRELIPFPGTPTTYGIPISLWNVDRFGSWYYSITLTPQEELVLRRALADLPVPPCGHTPILSCCQGKEKGLEKVCGLVRSALGLAKWLVHVKHFSPPEVRTAVDQWLRFIFSSHYLAEALAARGIDPTACGLPMAGTCVKDVYAGEGQGGCEVVGNGGSTDRGGGG